MMTGNSYLNCSDTGIRRHVREEHRLLNEELDKLFACCLGERHDCDSHTDWQKIRERVHRLRDNLAQHFCAEEAGLCLDEAVSRRATLGPEAREIEREHPELLDELDGLVEFLNREPPLETTLQTAKVRLNAFAENLRRHELREDALIRRGVGGFGEDD